AALAAPGGGETQLLETCAALQRIGVDAQFWRPWDDGFDHLDILHIFGSAPEHVEAIQLAKRRGVRTVVSTIAWFSWAAAWGEARPWPARLFHVARHAVRALAPGRPGWRQAMYDAADVLLPNSQSEADQLMRYFRIPAKKIVVVPNGADEGFAEFTPYPDAEVAALGRFVLLPGRIEPRKNQLNVLRALAGSEIHAVVLGDPAPGAEAYAAECRDVRGAGTTFLPRIPHTDRRLKNLYAAASALVLASWFETPGLVALEAGMLGTPLVLPAAGSACEYFGDLAEYVRADDLKGIRAAVERAVAQPRDARLAEHVRRHFTWTQVAERTRIAYEQIL
ncbi:MAG TPA: glycosyltransferase family 4 protein, partial [Pirellulales bacterium]